MKNLSKIILSLICVFSFSLNAYAVSSSISVSKTGDEFEYISGLKINENKSSSYKVYVLNKDTYYGSKTTLKKPVVADAGISYIINNSNVTSNSDRNYYIAQVAILWYQDVLNGNDNNISSDMKTYIKNNTKKTECYYINKLVNDAIKLGNVSESLEIITEDIKFTKDGKYYYSNEIEVSGNNLKSNPTIKLYNDPKNTDIVEEDLTKEGISTFKIKVPVDSLEDEGIIDFELSVSGKANLDSYYQYSDVIYGKKDSDTINVNDSRVITVEEFKTTYIKLEVLDSDEDYISGLNFKIYSDDCTNNTCSSKNLVHSFTTKNLYTSLNNKLTYGTYTVVLSSKTKYDLPEKTLIEVLNTDDTQKFTIKANEIEEDNNINNSDKEDNNETVYNKNITIYNDIKNKDNVISIYNVNNNLAKSFNSDNSPYIVNLSVGEYYIVDSNNLLDKVYFMVTSNDDLKVKVNGTYVKANDIKLYKTIFEEDIEEDSNIDNNESNNNGDSNNDTNNNYYVDENGSIHIDNLDGIDSIEITNKVETDTKVEINWLDKVINCPNTSLSSNLKYIIGAILLSTGLCLMFINVKRSKNNI